MRAILAFTGSPMAGEKISYDGKETSEGMALEGHVALITGATGGLGEVVTRTFLSHGATVVVSYRSPDSWGRLVQGFGPVRTRLHGVQADLLSADSIRRAVAEALKVAGHIDSLVNLVGGFAGGQPVAEADEETWHRMLGLNLTSAFLISRAVLPHMLGRNRGRIVHVSSRAAVEPFPKAAAYIASKAGVIALTRAIAAEVSGSGVTANVILPGTMDTPANRRNMPRADFSKWVRPQSLANAILFLVSEEAGEVNGAQLPVFGAA